MNFFFVATSPPQWTVEQSDLFSLFSCSAETGFTCFLFSTRQTTISNKALGLDFTESPCEMLWLDKLCVWRLKGSELGAVQLFAVCSQMPTDGGILESCPLDHVCTGSVLLDLRFLTVLGIKVSVLYRHMKVAKKLGKLYNAPEIFVQDFTFLEVIIPSY